MANGIRTGDLHGFNKGCSSKFHAGSRVQQTPEEGQRTYRPKCCGNNKDEDNCPKILNDKNSSLTVYFLNKVNYLSKFPILRGKKYGIHFQKKLEYLVALSHAFMTAFILLGMNFSNLKQFWRSAEYEVPFHHH